MNDPLELIMKERGNQDVKWGEQNHDDYKWLAILTEELGEVSKECLEADCGDIGALEKRDAELVQVAAVVVAWLDCIGRRSIKEPADA